jgi:predicted membrane channel-forming protein YqfA (hemolysin III family)
MLTLRKINAYIGLILVLIAATVAPMLRISIVGNWNLYQTDERLFFITFTLLAVTAFCLFLRQIRAFRFFSFLLLLLSVLMAIAVYFQSHHYLGKKLFDGLISKTISYQWGWIVLLVGVLLLVTSVKKQELSVEDK